MKIRSPSDKHRTDKGSSKGSKGGIRGVSILMMILDAIEIIISMTDLFKRLHGMHSGKSCSENHKRKETNKNFGKEFSRKYAPINWQNRPI